jgi:hypothetical protein
MGKGKLKACPFCGAEAFTWVNLAHEGWFKISCMRDCVTMPSRPDIWFTSESEAETLWNRRKEVKDA